MKRNHFGFVYSTFHIFPLWFLQPKSLTSLNHSRHEIDLEANETVANKQWTLFISIKTLPFQELPSWGNFWCWWIFWDCLQKKRKKGWKFDESWRSFHNKKLISIWRSKILKAAGWLRREVETGSMREWGVGDGDGGMRGWGRGKMGFKFAICHMKISQLKTFN